MNNNIRKKFLENYSAKISELTKAAEIINKYKDDLVDLQIENTAMVREFAQFDIDQLAHIWGDAEKLLEKLYYEQGIDLSEREGFRKIGVLLPSDAIMPFGLVYLSKVLFDSHIEIKPSSRTRTLYGKLEQLFEKEKYATFLKNKDGSSTIDYLNSGQEFFNHALNLNNKFEVLQVFGSDSYFTPHIESLIVQNNSLEKVILEGPGNNEFIVVSPITDLQKCAKSLVDMSIINSGQVCQATGIAYVDEKIHDELLKHIIKYASEKKIGDPRLSETNIGPISDGIAMHLYSQIQDAILKGAKIVFATPEVRIETETHKFWEGKKEIKIKPPVPYKFKDKYSYIPLVIITDIKDNMRVQQEETFGPIIPIQKFSNIRELYQKINNNRYGLNAVIFGDEYKYKIDGRTPESSPLIHILQKNVGKIFINQTILDGGAYDVLLDPWGGFKNSRFALYGKTLDDGKRVLVKEQTGPSYTVLDFSREKNKK